MQNVRQRVKVLKNEHSILFLCVSVQRAFNAKIRELPPEGVYYVRLEIYKHVLAFYCSKNIHILQNEWMCVPLWLDADSFGVYIPFPCKHFVVLCVRV